MQFFFIDPIRKLPHPPFGNLIVTIMLYKKVRDRDMTKVDIEIEKRMGSKREGTKTVYILSFWVGRNPKQSSMAIVNNESLDEAVHILVAAAIRARSLDGKMTSREQMLESLYPAARRRIHQLCR